MAVLKSLWSKEEEGQATEKVLRDSFNPKVVPRVRIWLNEAKADEKKAVMKLFRSMANQNPSQTNQKTFPNQENTSHPSRPVAVASLSTKDSDIAKPGTIQSKKVTWKNLHTSMKTTGRLIPLAPLRTEFDIAPDWRAPKRIVVPMTQVPREDPGKDSLPNLTKHVSHHGRNEREFVIHPEWIKH